MDTDAPKDAAGGKDKEKEKKRKIIKKPVPFTAVQQGGLTAAQARSTTAGCRVANAGFGERCFLCSTSASSSRKAA